MEFNLTAEQKLQALQGAEAALSIELYNTLLRAGVDPETFDESEIETLKTPGTDGEFLRIEKLLASLSVVKQKLNPI